MKDIINKYLPVPLRLPLLLQLIILSGSLYIGDLSQLVHPDLLKMYESMPTLSISTTLALSCLLWAASYIFLILKNRDKFKPKFGILWDKNKEPYCPACKTLLSGYTEEPPDHFFFWCHHCKTNVFIYHGKGIRLSEARKQI
jgi:hypothetical protein